MDPCSWYGVECSDGNVVVLNLEDRYLGGTLAPALGNLVHLKSIILRNNSFYGIIPEVIGELKDLKLLDLGYNNFSGPIPSELGNNLSLTILNNVQTGGATSHRLLEKHGADPSKKGQKSLTVHAPLPSPSSSPSPLPTSESPSSSPSPSPSPALLSLSPSPTPSLTSKSPHSSPSPSPAPSTVPSRDSNSVPPYAYRPSLSVPIQYTRRKF